MFIFLPFYLVAESESFGCSFDIDFCLWKQDTSDVFDWQRQAVRDSLTTTGPTVDHSGSKKLIL